MKTWAWILIGGGAFTTIAGWLASRAKANWPAYTVIVFVPGGTVTQGANTADEATVLARNLMAARGGTGAQVYYNPSPTSSSAGTLVRTLNAQGQEVQTA